jgi:FkbM family methyltransferase
VTQQKSSYFFGHFFLRNWSLFFYYFCQKLPRNRFFFRLSLAIRKNVLRYNKIIDAEIFGIRFRLYPFENLGERFVLFSPQYYEDEERKYLDSHLRADSVFIDIGANTGFYSLYCAKIIQKGTILAFEPNPIMFDRLRENISFNSFARVIELFPIGIADKNSKFQLSYLPNNLGSGSITQTQHANSIQVSCRPLGDILREKEIQHIDFLKIDIEGGETLALKIFFDKEPRTLWPKFLIIENENALDFTSLGYRFIKRTHSHNSIFEFTKN